MSEFDIDKKEHKELSIITIVKLLTRIAGFLNLILFYFVVTWSIDLVNWIRYTEGDEPASIVFVFILVVLVKGFYPNGKK